MRYLLPAGNLFCLTWRGALLLVLGAAAQEARGQSFGPVATYSAGVDSQPRAVALGDLNGDGRLDIATANAITSTAGVLLGLAGGGFAPVTTYSTGISSGPLDVALGDVNNDGRLDIATANTSNTVTVLQGQAGGGFGFAAYNTGANTGPSGLALGDVNRDGRLDVVTANYIASTAGVRLGLAAGGFGPATNYSTGATTSGSYPPSPTVIVLSDVNGDGRLDVVANNYYNVSAGVLLGLASGGFGAVTEYYTSANGITDDLALGDVNGDGRPDLVTVSYYGDGARVVLAQASGGFVANTFDVYSTGTDSGPRGLALGDVNGDGRLDIVTANYKANTVGVLLGQAGGVFAAPVTYPVGAGSTPVNVALGDLNGDRRLDIVVANATANTVGVLLNTGTYTPLAAARPVAADLSLAPNPAHESFAVTLPATASPGPAELLNTLGQVVRRLTPAGPHFVVETAGLAPGLYTLRVTLGAATVARRVVVE